MKEWMEACIEAAMILLVLFLLCWPVKIEGNSMEKSFTENDRVMISRAMKMAGIYHQGDFVVISAIYNGQEKEMIKRMIADEGDHVLISNDSVSVNGIQLEENYIIGDTEGEIDMIVPDNCIFVLGDNREHSVDSRKFGPIQKNKVTGRVIFKWFPFQNVKLYF